MHIYEVESFFANQPSAKWSHGHYSSVERAVVIAEKVKKKYRAKYPEFVFSETLKYIIDKTEILILFYATELHEIKDNSCGGIRVTKIDVDDDVHPYALEAF